MVIHISVQPLSFQLNIEIFKHPYLYNSKTNKVKMDNTSNKATPEKVQERVTNIRASVQKTLNRLHLLKQRFADHNHQITALIQRLHITHPAANLDEFHDFSAPTQSLQFPPSQKKTIATKEEYDQFRTVINDFVPRLLTIIKSYNEILDQQIAMIAKLTNHLKDDTKIEVNFNTEAFIQN